MPHRAGRADRQILPGTGKAGETPTYVNAAFPNVPTVDSSPAFPKTAYEAFNIGYATHPNSPSLGRREWSVAKGDWADEYSWETYSDTAATRTHLGAGLIKLQQDGAVGSPDKTAWSVGIWSANRPEWQHASQACSAYSLVLVSLCSSIRCAALPC